MRHGEDCPWPQAGSTAATPTAVGVVVPAHNEVGRLAACLAAVGAAANRVAGWGVDVRTLVVCDTCTDGTPLAAGAVPVLQVAGPNVGAARDRGVRTLLADLAASGHPYPRIWLASTDADTVVPADWLDLHLDYARRGAHVVVGTVALADDEDHSIAVRDAVMGRYVRRPGHPHVHGANLGVRADAYLDSGGFPHLPAHEDIALVERLERRGWRLARTACVGVRTSARLDGRAPAGLAATLRDAVSA